MSAYIIAEIEITDPAAYERYKPLASASVARHGGRFIARGGAAELLEGVPAPHRVVILEFPTAEAARRFHASPDYAEAIAVRQASSRSRLILVEGVAQP